MVEQGLQTVLGYRRKLYYESLAVQAEEQRHRQKYLVEMKILARQNGYDLDVIKFLSTDDLNQSLKKIE